MSKLALAIFLSLAMTSTALPCDKPAPDPEPKHVARDPHPGAGIDHASCVGSYTATQPCQFETSSVPYYSVPTIRGWFGL